MKKKSNRLLTLLICFIFVMLAAASGEDKAIQPTPTAMSVPANANNNSAEEVVNEELQEAQLAEEMVLLDSDGILIKATSLEKGILGGVDVKLYIENNTDQPITVQTRNVSVNGIMVDPLLSCDVVQDKKAMDAISFSATEFKNYGIEEPANIELVFHVFNTDTWDTILDTDVISIKTSVADTYVQEYNTSGEVLYDVNGIKIVYQGLNEDGFLGPECNLYIENNTDTMITIQARDVSINGFMIDPILSSDVVPGKKAFDEITFMNSDLEENSITQIDEIELSFYVFNSDTWDTIVDTDPIIVSIK